MLSTRVGYAGGTTANPTYHQIGDHSESVQVVFDPSVISYGRLLELFWSSHEPTGPSYSRQYMSLVLVRDDGQRRSAERSKRAEEQRRGRPLATEILSDWSFTPAEGYHQKYSLRSDALLLRELSAVYRLEEDLVGSTAAARINGYLGGYGTLEELDREITSFGLSPEAAQHLRQKVARLRP